MEVGEYHWQDGWFFKRLEDGSVRIRVDDGSMGGGLLAVVQPDEWASIVAHVALGGGTSSEYEAARKLHAAE